ncbi:MAG: hypothetical protein LBK82_17455 [Planctomycetaceae bacterium]|jgi:hypothetical protein|nr:hypothetical protein [Planctomycetaceae bacterium]
MIKYFFLFLFLFVFTGCDSHVHISGTVTFPDGKPLTKGTVVFQSDTFVAKGDLNNSGQYYLGSFRKSDGLPLGFYKVYISGAGAVPEGFVAPTGSEDSGYVPWVDSRFASAAATPIQCDVSKGMTFNFQVDPYNK